MLLFKFSVEAKLIFLTTSLFTFTFIGAGFFYETNDDIFITFMLQGIGAIPASDLTLYFHGLSKVLSALYQLQPVWPWYGIFLYSILFISTVLAFRFIYYSLKDKLSPNYILLVILFFYLANWYEHVFWVNYSRLPILLTSVLVLNAWLDFNRYYHLALWRTVGYCTLFFIALCIRPSLAVYGAVLTFPVIFLGYQKKIVTSKRLILFAIPIVLTGLLFGGWLITKSNHLSFEYRHLDLVKSQILDYNWCCRPFRETNKNLIITGIQNWFFADTQIQLFLKQKVQPDWLYFWQEAVLPKFRQVITNLLFDQFVVLITIFSYLVWLIKTLKNRDFFRIMLYHGFFWFVVFIVGIIFKMPPRILTTSISLIFLGHIVIAGKTGFPEKIPQPVIFVFLIMLFLQVYKISHRVHWQKVRQNQSEQVIAELQQRQGVLIAAGLEQEFRALSPIKTYTLGNRPVLFLTGWQTLDPVYAQYLISISGSGTLSGAIQNLIRHKNVVWVSSPEFVNFLSEYYKTIYHQSFNYNFIKPVESRQNAGSLNYYKISTGN